MESGPEQEQTFIDQEPQPVEEEAAAVARPVPASLQVQQGASNIEMIPQKTEVADVTPSKSEVVANAETIAKLVTVAKSETVGKVDSTPPAETGKPTKVAGQTVSSDQAKVDADVKPKPLVSSTVAPVKKDESTVVDLTKTSAEAKVEDNADSEDDTQDVFNNPSETPGEFGNPDADEDEDDYTDVLSKNNQIPEYKMPNGPDGTPQDEVSRKTVKVVDFEGDPDSNFFTYLCGLMFLCVLLYILHQNRQKILALFLEGRRGSRRGRERSRGGSKAAYSKLDCNLEEAITSKKSLSGKSMDIIY